MAKPILTAERLRELLDYNPETGIFTWRVPRQGIIKLGCAAGSLGTNGYIKICCDGWTHLAHRLVWLYMYEEWPTYNMDHVNGMRNDNRRTNLRDVPHAVNMQNKRAPAANTSSGFLGVYPTPRGGRKFRACIGVNGTSVYLGCFLTAEAASVAYLSAKRLLHQGCTI